MSAPYWQTPEWQASFVANLVATGISDRRADELLGWYITWAEENAARDEAHEGERRGS